MYGSGSTIENLPMLDHVNIDVTNGAIYWQLKLGVDVPGIRDYGEGTWDAEVYMIPGSRSLTRKGLVGVRFRAAVLAANLPSGASQAIATVEAVW